jgi:hypothetical protein
MEAWLSLRLSWIKEPLTRFRYEMPIQGLGGKESQA